MSGGIEGAGDSQPRDARQEPKAERGRINIVGTIRSVHKIASLEKIPTSQYAHIINLMQTVAANPEPIPVAAWIGLQRDLTTIQGLLPESEPAKQVRDTIDAFLVGLQASSWLELIPEELRGEIFSHVPDIEVVKLRGVSKFFKASETVRKAYLLQADTIAEGAIKEILEAGQDLSSLENKLPSEIRLAVRSLSFVLRKMTSENLQTIVSLFPNLTTLSLVACELDDGSLSPLSALTDLRSLDISANSDLTGRTFDQLPLSLRELDVSRCLGVTDENIPRLFRLINLQTLIMELCPKITGSTFDKLPVSLLRLNIESCDLTDRSVGLLSHLIILQKLNIRKNTDITGSTLSQLPLSLQELCATWKHIQVTYQHQLHRSHPKLQYPRYW